MVTMFIKTFSRTSPTSIIFSRCWDPGRKVVKQYPTATVQFTCLQRSMQMLTIKKIPIHGTHNTIQHIASARVHKFVPTFLEMTRQENTVYYRFQGWVRTSKQMY